MNQFEKEIKNQNIVKSMSLEFGSSIKSDQDLEKAIDIVAESFNIRFREERMSEQDIEKSFGHLDDILKARSVKYFKREGAPGHYKYYYTKEQYQKEKGAEKTGEEKEGKTKEETYLPKKGESVKFRDKVFEVISIDDTEVVLKEKGSEKASLAISTKKFDSEYKEIIGRKPIHVGGKDEEEDRKGDDPSSKQYHDRTIKR